MPVNIELYGPYREIVGSKEVSLDVTSETAITTVMEMISDRWPELTRRLYSDGDGLAAGVIVLKNERPIRKKESSTTTVTPGDTLSIAPAISGGTYMCINW